MTTLHRSDGGVTAYAKGAPERILSHCTNAQGASTAIAIDTRRSLLQRSSWPMQVTVCLPWLNANWQNNHSKCTRHRSKLA